MILLYCVILVLGYALAAAWAVRRGGGGRLAFSAPGVLLPTLLLWAQRARPRAQSAALPIALVGGVLGLGVGWVVVVYGLGAW